MRFRDQRVWVRGDAAGRPILDGDGRAEMKYRESDAKSYRPGPGNLLPDSAGGQPPEILPDSAAAPKKPAAARRPAAAGAGAGAGKLGVEPTAGVVHIWTDGACSGNPGPMGIGMVVIDGKSRREAGEYLGVGTNNIAELTAIARGLEIALDLVSGDSSRPMRIYSDSSYALGLLGKGWKAKANQELVARLRKQAAAFENLQLVKVPGHAGVPENERCDELAREAIELRRAVS
jgi:ribonuclease HI